MEHETDGRVEDWERGFDGLMEWLLKTNPSPSHIQRCQLRAYCSYLYYSSGKINLIAEGDRPDLAAKHIMPALGMAGLLAAVPNATVLDLGSGAGLPGIPLKIVFPESYFYLVESRRKRANFLREVTRKLGLEKIEVRNERIEALRVGLARAVDVVVSRATKNPVELLEWAKPVLKPYGIIITTLDPGKGQGEGKGIMLRRKTEWAKFVSWHGGVR